MGGIARGRIGEQAQEVGGMGSGDLIRREPGNDGLELGSLLVEARGLLVRVGLVDASRGSGLAGFADGGVEPHRNPVDFADQVRRRD